MLSVLSIRLNLTCIIICGLSIRVSQLKSDNRAISNLSRNVANEVHAIKAEKEEMRKEIENLRGEINSLKNAAVNKDNVEERVWKLRKIKRIRFEVTADRGQIFVLDSLI